jgi:hypothetical protein
VQGIVNLGDRATHVTSEDSGYDRELPHQEAQELGKAADTLRTSGVQGDASSRSNSVRDGYQYHITLVTADGEKKRVSLDTAGGSPEMEYLLKWIQGETQKIWMHRVKRR